MGWEIERKFLLKDDSWRSSADAGIRMIQGYIAGDAVTPAVRIRIAGTCAFLTIKGQAKDLVRSEFEYEIPVADAEYMLGNLCGTRVVEKIRYRSGRWEIDEYLGRNLGLFTAEIELESAEEHFDVPSWLGAEISGDPAYCNGALSSRPYSGWKEAK